MAAPVTNGPSAGAEKSAPNRKERARQRRVARFSRPPERRDWRWVLGGIGRVLVSLGVLMFAFVAYQLWGTGLATARAQNDLESAFEELIATPATTLPAPTTTAAATPAPPTTEPPPPPPAGVAPLHGEPLARLEIPSIGVDKIVVEGVRYDDLRKGPGHFPETPLPGQLGNAAIAGHRTTYGQPFHDIDLVQIGDDLVVTASWGSRYVYTVTETLIVRPDEYSAVIPTLDPDLATLTLISCHPKWSADNRIVVRAVIDPSRSDQVTQAGRPGEPDLVGLETTTTVAATTTTAPGSAVATTTGGSGPATSVPTTIAAGDTGSEAGTDDGAAASTGVDGEEAFSSKWFDDPQAYPLVGFWGLVLTAIALLATALSRRVLRNWVGFAAGILPFTVALYFFFAAISRMMPANL